MRFIVDPQFKGRLVLNSISSPLYANAIVSISKDSLYASDIRNAIKNKLLIPEEGDREEYEKIKEEARIRIVNKIDKVLILKDINLRPKGSPGSSLIINKAIAEKDYIQKAKINGVIELIELEEKKEIKKEEKVKEGPDLKVEEEDIFKEEDKTTAVTWDFKGQELKKAEKTPKTKSIDDGKIIDEDEIEESSEELVVVKIPEKIIPKKVIKKKTKKRKIAKKKTTKRKTTKKKEIKSKKTNKVIEAVGEVKTEKNSVDVAIELDSRGNPINKASDWFQDLIDEVADTEVSFVDEEQKERKLKERDLDN